MSDVDPRFFWTPSEWDEYEQKSVSIPATLLDSLIDAAGFAARGTRVEKGFRDKWHKVEDEAAAYLHKAVEDIDSSPTGRKAKRNG